MLIFLFQLLAIFLGGALPVCMIQAIRADAGDKQTRYTALSAVCGGLLIFILIAL